MPYHPFITRAVPNMVMRRERMLPFRGEVLVGTGSRVRASDVIARTTIPGEIRLLNVARNLGLDSTDLSPYLKVAIGDEVKEGDVLAAGSGASRLLGRSYRSPMAGTVVNISHGRVLLQSARSTLELTAHYRGTVINVMSNLGAIIEVRGALIQGIWGTDKAGFGVLRMMVGDRTKSFDLEDLDMSCRGTVLMGAPGVSTDILRRAQEVEVQGIVVGGLDSGLVDLVRSLPFPVVVTEGMGKLPISEPVFDLLKAYDGQEASIRGATELRGGTARPEVVVYASYAGGDAEQETRPEFLLELGGQVRVVRGPHMGEVGKVASFRSSAGALPLRTKAMGVEVLLESGEAILVPQANVESLG
jgi:hypothetical protein